MTAARTGDAIIKDITIRASAERVFEALVDPRQRVKWWGAPGRFQATDMESDLRVGGLWMMSCLGGDGKAHIFRGEYRAVDRPYLLEFTWLPEGDSAPPTVVRFELEEHQGTTTVRLTHSGFTSDAARERYQGWPWLLSLLQAHVETDAPSPASA